MPSCRIVFLRTITYLPLCYLLLFYINSTAQPGNTAGNFLVNNGGAGHFNKNGDNNKPVTKISIQRVDSVAHATGISRHFGSLYNKVMENVEVQLQNRNVNEKYFVQKFEITFADFFLNACVDYKNGSLPPTSEWNKYFTNPGAKPLQIVLLGINAHTNGDMWQSLVKNFSEKEIRHNKKQLLDFQSSIIKVYYPFFDSLVQQNGWLRFGHSSTKHLDKNVIERVIYRWRLRQVNLAIHYYHNQKKFKRRLVVLNRKKENIDELILHHMKMLLPKD
jgi:hypothetical protein